VAASLSLGRILAQGEATPDSESELDAEGGGCHGKVLIPPFDVVAVVRIGSCGERRVSA